MVNELWIDLADGIDVEETGVLEGLEDLMVDVVEIGDVFLLVVVLSKGGVGVGIVGSGGRYAELGGGGKGVVLCGYDVRVPILMIAIGS